MKKFFVLLALALLVPIISTTKLKADEFGSNSQYYRVVYDGEGEAATYAKLTYVNLTKTPISELKLSIPGKNIRVLSIIQEKAQSSQYCVQYSASSSSGPGVGIAMPRTSPLPCLEWREVPSGQKTYSLIERDATKDVVEDNVLDVTVKLNEAIESTKSGTVIITYKANGLATKTWDGYNYSFKTIKSAYDVANVRVAIDVTSDDLYIKSDATASTNYVGQLAAPTSLDATGFKASAPAEQYSNMIENSSGVVKQTSSLDPNESFEVTGSIYSNNWMGNLTTYIVVGLTFLLLLGVIVYIIRSERKK